VSRNTDLHQAQTILRS